MNDSRTIELTPECISRFWASLERGSDEDCWPWTGEIHTNGYGIISKHTRGQRRRFYAHRLSLLIAGIDISGRVVRHDCDNPPCVNPAHLRTGTQADNVRDAFDRGRLNTTGLALGWNWTPGPRPCVRCGATVEEGRRRYCPPCKKVATLEAHRRYRARNAA